MLFKMNIVICIISRPLETLKQYVNGKGFEIFKRKKRDMKNKREVTIKIHWELSQYLI